MLAPTSFPRHPRNYIKGAARAAVPIWEILAKAIAIHTGSGPIMTKETC